MANQLWHGQMYYVERHAVVYYGAPRMVPNSCRQKRKANFVPVPIRQKDRLSAENQWHQHQNVSLHEWMGSFWYDYRRTRPFNQTGRLEGSTRLFELLFSLRSQTCPSRGFEGACV
jgi:hypothetical protein